MADDSCLVAAILAEPADDTARLVYADWLDENDDHIRAAIIRAGVANPEGYILACNYYQPNWTFSGAKGLQPRGTAARLRRELPELSGFSDPRTTWFFFRGFLRTVRTTYATWADHADGLRLVHPIEQVELTSEPVNESPLRELTMNTSRLGTVPRRDRLEEEYPHLRKRWHGINFTRAF